MWFKMRVLTESPKQSTLSKFANKVWTYASQLGISGPWRFKPPQSKVSSFVSHVHHTFSQIDFLLLDNKLLQLVSLWKYHPIATSDHIPT